MNKNLLQPSVAQFGNHQPPAWPTIGVLTSDLSQYPVSILRGILGAARIHDVSIRLFSGGILNAPLAHDRAANVLYEFATPDTLDALIVLSGTLISYLDADQLAAFSARFPIPKISIGSSLPDAHNVLLDNYAGMREALTHLIAVHGYRDIAFIQGPTRNQEARLRFQAYRDTLEEFAITYDPLLVVTGHFTIASGSEAICTLLDERKANFRAIVGANDVMAIGAMNELQRRAIAIPGQVAVVGFDNIPDSGAVLPALTTIRQPLYEQGSRALEAILSLLRGETVPNPLMLIPDLITRRTCGCLAAPVPEIRIPLPLAEGVSLEKQLIAAKPSIVAEMIAHLAQPDSVQTSEPPVDALYNALLADLSQPGRSDSRQFNFRLDSILQGMLIERQPIGIWHGALSVMRNSLLPLLAAFPAENQRAETLWQQSRLLITNAVQHADANQQMRARNQAQALTAIGEPLLAVTEISGLGNILTDGLPRLGITGFCIALYEDDSREWARCVFLYHHTQDHSFVALPESAERFPARDLIPVSLWPDAQPRMLLVEALYFEQTQFGFIVLESDQVEVNIYQALRKQISSTLQTATMMQQLQEKQTLLESTLDGLKTTQAMLVHSEKMNALGQMVAGVAHEINNPIAFVNSNIHSLNTTFEDLVAAYDRLEAAVRAGDPLQPADLDRLRQQTGVDFAIEDTRDLVTQTLGGLKRVKDIVTELRKFSRLDEAEFKLSNLRENVESTLLIASGELRNRIQVALNIDPALSLICAPAELNQVFLNIIVNAAQAIDGKGTITISAHETHEMVTITFQDTGCGIPDTVIARIFDPFFTTKPIGVGTGLGLAIAHRIVVNSHKGSIRVTSRPGAGTLFMIDIPKEPTR